jgi:hypothetical protein
VILSGPSAIEAIPVDIAPASADGARISRGRLAAIEAEQAALRPMVEADGVRIVASFSRLLNGF